MKSIVQAGHLVADPDPLAELAKLQATVANTLASAGAFSAKSQLLENQFISPAGGAARVFASMSSFNIASAQYVIDFEYSIRETRAKALATPIQIAPMNFNGGIWQVTIVVANTVEFGWASRPGQKPRNDSLVWEGRSREAPPYPDRWHV